MSAITGVIGALVVGAGVYFWVKFLRDRIRGKPIFAKREIKEPKPQPKPKPPKPEKQKPSNYSKFLKIAIDSKLQGKEPPKLKIKPQKIEFKRSTRNDTKFDSSAIYDKIRMAENGD